jgi:hypothetical protein
VHKKEEFIIIITNFIYPKKKTCIVFASVHCWPTAPMPFLLSMFPCFLPVKKETYLLLLGVNSLNVFPKSAQL